MKKTFRAFGMLLCAIFMAVGFTSCSDDDDDPEEAIVGTWLLTERDEDGDGYWYVQLNIKGNGTFESKEWWSEEPDDVDAYTGSWSISGDRLTISWNYGETEIYRISIKGGKLTIYDYEGDGGSIVFVRK